jgi:multidrug efflux system membrane fusion protein
MRTTHQIFARLALLAAGLATLGCGNGQGPSPQEPPEVTVSLPVRRDVTDFHEYTGRIESPETVEIRARVKGYLQKIHFKEGTEVKADKLLYEIDPRTFEAEVERARAEVSRAEAQLDLARAEADRAARLRGTGAISEEESRTRVAARDTASATLRQAQAALEAARLELGFTKIRAPITGRISRTLVTEGNLVGFNEPTLLTTIVRLDPMYVYFDVPERNYLEYTERIRHEGAATAAEGTIPVYVGLAHERGFPHTGLIKFRDNRADPGTGTVLIRGELPNPDRLLTPGLFARVRVPVGKPRPRLLVPEAAIAADQRGQYVLVVGEDDTVVSKHLTTGASENGLVVIDEGLDAGDRVIVNGLQRARPGGKVQPVERDAEEPSPTDAERGRDRNRPALSPANTPGSPGQPDISPPSRPRE